MRLMFTCVLGLGHASTVLSVPKLQALVYDILLWRKVPERDARSVISTHTFRRALTASVDSSAEMKGLQWRTQIWVRVSRFGLAVRL